MWLLFEWVGKNVGVHDSAAKGRQQLKRITVGLRRHAANDSDGVRGVNSPFSAPGHRKMH